MVEGNVNATNTSGSSLTHVAVRTVCVLDRCLLMSLDVILQYTVLLSRTCLPFSFAARSFVLLEVFAALVKLQTSVAAAV